jgi:hypothetical protein
LRLHFESADSRPHELRSSAQLQLGFLLRAVSVTGSSMAAAVALAANERAMKIAWSFIVVVVVLVGKDEGVRSREYLYREAGGESWRCEVSCATKVQLARPTTEEGEV